jgi:hypothetical protein
MKKAFFILLILAAGLFYGSPYYTMYKLEQATKTGDSAAFNELIDFEALRRSFKEQINAQVDREAGGFPAAALTSLFTDQIIDSYVSPAAIRTLLAGKKPESGSSLENDEIQFEKFDTRFVSLSLFEIKVETTHEKPVFVLLGRDGLTWRVKEVILPLN